MPLSRRGLLARAAAPARLLAATADIGLFEARAARVRLAPPGYRETEVWTVGGTMPGVALRVTQGGCITRTLRNALPHAASGMMTWLRVTV